MIRVKTVATVLIDGSKKSIARMFDTYINSQVSGDIIILGRTSYGGDKVVYLLGNVPPKDRLTDSTHVCSIQLAPRRCKYLRYYPAASISIRCAEILKDAL